jgi:3-dehydroquinate dehydratase II
MTLAALNSRLRSFARKRGITLRIHQSNCEGDLIDLLHGNRKWASGIVLNPGAYTHYSYALRDAVSAIAVPTFEVHLSDIRRREKFRRVSVIAPACRGQISGLHWRSYTEAMERIVKARGR